MLDSIRVLQEALTCEKDAKEKWHQRYEVEREQASKMNEELVILRNEFKDLEIVV